MSDTKEREPLMPTRAMLAHLGVAVGVGINIGANGHERKAGRILQGKP